MREKKGKMSFSKKHIFSESINIFTMESKVRKSIISVMLLVGATSSSAQNYTTIKAECEVTHSGYEGMVVAPMRVAPTGTIEHFQCNNYTIEIASNQMKSGIIETKLFGKVRVRFGSDIETVGAGEHIQVSPKMFVPAEAQVAVLSAHVQKFKSAIMK